jgi:hypothetical protein
MVSSSQTFTEPSPLQKIVKLRIKRITNNS